MFDTEKFRIKPLEDKDDFRLWRIRVAAACDSKGLENVLFQERCNQETAEEKNKFLVNQKKASNLIVAALSDRALRVVRAEIGNPCKMLQKLDERYDSKSAATRIAKKTELTSMRYDNRKKNMGVHIDQMAGILDQLQSMNAPIPDELAIALLISPIQVTELAPVPAAVKTLSDEEATWEKITARLLEEHQAIKSRTRHHERAAPARKQCKLCKKPGHTIDNCWINPRNPKNTLGISPTTVREASNESNSSRTHMDGASKEGNRKKDKKTRVAVARAMASREARDKLMMLDSGTTSHMTNCTAALRNPTSCNVPIALGGDSEINATSRGTRTVSWASQDGETEVHLTDTLAYPELAMSLLSIPALTEKGLCCETTGSGCDPIGARREPAGDQWRDATDEGELGICSFETTAVTSARKKGRRRW